MTFSKRRKAVIARDGKCTKCGSIENLTVDHIIPLSRGGLSSFDNLTTLCKRCNMKKSSSIAWSFWERVQMIFHVDEIIQKFVNELKSHMTANLGTARTEMASMETRLVNKINISSNGEHNKVATLEARIKALEEYLKVEYVVETLEFRGYKKLKK